MNSQHGWIRVAAASPEVAVADPRKNQDFLLASITQLVDEQADLAVFPELCLTGYTCADLLQHSTLLQAAENALTRLTGATAELPIIFVVGLPVAVVGQLFNCAVAIQAGTILGVVPKTIIPNYREFYERRWFSPAEKTSQPTITLAGQSCPFGTDLIFTDETDSRFSFGLEICEDLWAPVPPSTKLALGGATILLNLSASNELAGKDEYRRQLVRQQSGRCLAAYAYSAAGPLESTTDLVFGGHCMIAENAVMLQESARFNRQYHALIADVDIEFLTHERRQNQTFNSQVGEFGGQLRRLPFKSPLSQAGRESNRLRRPIAKLPFVPADTDQRRQRCEEIMAIQTHGLATRMQRTGINKLIIGLSGGLDSTLALLVTIEACRLLKLQLTHIHGFTMPGFGTSEQTLNHVISLARETGIELGMIDIRPACEQHFKDIGHDGKTADTTYENVQARERTQILMNKANMLNGLVVGTGDLSELALGWSTYGGDQISMYNVNAGVPKTLVAYLIGQFAENCGPDQEKLKSLLREILATPISPELLPAQPQARIHHQTEEIIGPYRLHDFFLYYLIRCGFSPRKVLRLAQQAFTGDYEPTRIKDCLEIFIRRFFSQQFKRSCLPDGPKVGTIALSPRGDWRMPSDVQANTWLSDLTESAATKPKQ